MKKKQYYSVKDYATECDVSEATVYRRIREGVISLTKIEMLGMSISVIDSFVYPPLRLREKKSNGRTSK